MNLLWLLTNPCFVVQLRELLGVPADANVIFERYSDSAGSYILLDESNTAVYKQLYRAAKAKLKLRIKASTVVLPVLTSTDSSTAAQEPARHNYLETVLSSPIPAAHMETLPASSEPVLRSAGAKPDQKENHPPENPLRQTTLPVGQPRLPPFDLKQDSNHPLENPLRQLNLSVGQPRLRDFEMERDSKFSFPNLSHSSHPKLFYIDCNVCKRSITDEHYHCSICEGGDFDMCPECVSAGLSCFQEGHWLIKRGVVNGVVTNSTTETIPSRSMAYGQDDKSVPAGMSLKAQSVPEPVTEMAASTTPSHGCKVCKNHRVCLCSSSEEHGHHPARDISMSSRGNSMSLLAGTTSGHNAICDGCEKVKSFSKVVMLGLLAD